jgi:hypothetical protein
MLQLADSYTTELLMIGTPELQLKEREENCSLQIDLIIILSI